MDAKLMAIEVAKKEITSLEKLKKEVSFKLNSNSTLDKTMISTLEEKLKQLDLKLVAAKKELAAATSATDLVDPAALDNIENAPKKEEKTAEEKAEEEKKAKEAAEAEAKRALAELLKGDIATVIEQLKEVELDPSSDEFKTLIEKVLTNMEDVLTSKLKVEIFQIKKNSIISRAFRRAKKNTSTAVVLSAKLEKDLTVELTKKRNAALEKQYKIDKSTGFTGLDAKVKSIVVATFEKGIAGRDWKTILNTILEEVAATETFIDSVKNTRVKVVQSFNEIIQTKAKAKVDTLVETLKKSFFSVNKEFISKKIGPPVIPIWGFLSVNIGLTFSLAAKCSVINGQGLTLNAQADMTGSVLLNVGLVLGLKNVPILGDMTIEGGIEGGPELVASTYMQFKYREVWNVSVQPIIVNLNLVAYLYLEVSLPQFIIDRLKKYIPDFSSDGVKITYKLGSLNILTVTTSSYSFIADLAKSKYKYLGSEGKFSVKLNEASLQKVKDFKDSLFKSAENAVKTVNPANWDWNPLN